MPHNFTLPLVLVRPWLVAFKQAKAALLLEDISEEEIPEVFLQDGIEAENFILVEPG
ncbi:hypothetical protein [uncultured Mailhella sp.]|uniref:hypothetical protein n=1 Tax=uncultured Mailhella sp. TaxID=1981031 RepID=UPI00261DAFAE|nr:hypothetical protein [uncultured Mailhella sp.]